MQNISARATDLEEGYRKEKAVSVKQKKKDVNICQ